MSVSTRVPGNAAAAAAAELRRRRRRRRCQGPKCQERHYSHESTPRKGSVMKHKPNRTGKLLHDGAGNRRSLCLRQTGNSDMISRKWMGETKFRESKFVRRGPEADPPLRGAARWESWNRINTEMQNRYAPPAAAAT